MAQSAPFSRLTRGGFPFPSRHDTKKKPQDEDEWYIPYNGPIEQPRETPRRQKVRDSWGDALDEFDEGGVLDDEELQNRYGGARHSNGRFFEDERKGRSRDRAFSVNSTRTTSSGAMDPGRGSFTINRRSTVSAAHPPPVPSYVSIDAVGGGVGESPVPHLKNSKETHRISIASIFSFGGSHRKSVASPKPERTRTISKTNRPQRGDTLLHHEKDKGHGKLDFLPHASGSQQRTEPKQSKHQRLRDQVKAQDERVESTVTDDSYYSHTHYQSLPQGDHDRTRLLSPTYQPRSPTASYDSPKSSSPRHDDSGMSRQNSTSTTSTNSGHPYANAIPALVIPPLPQTAPPSSAPHTGFAPPRLTFTNAGPSSTGLKNSTSTPNLRSPVPTVTSRPTSAENGNMHAPTPTPKFVFPKGKERWLSAETWCDALLFPRPRLRLKQEIPEQQQQTGAPVSTGRIVSPPGTPTEQRDFELQQQREPGIASRVLAHSRSLVDLSLNKGKKKEEAPPPQPILREPQLLKTTAPPRPPRPKSFALDDLALPSPVPSLAHVLREGALLDSERKAWQRQAQGSFGNKRSRTVSRTRSKSLTQKARKPGHQHQTSMEFITAQACLGSQNYSPGIAPPRLAYLTDGTGTSVTTSRGTHSHSNSLVKTLTKSSKSHSRTHSRNESWSKSAMKMVTKPAVLAPVSMTDTPATSSAAYTPPQHKQVDLEGALRGHSTRVIRLADPAHLPLDRGTSALAIAGAGIGFPTQAAPRKTPSPAFSAISDSKVGIALGTPPDEDSTSYGMSSHPYAQGGLSFSTAPRVENRSAEYAGPHRSINIHTTKVPPISDILARHKLPPHIVLHPYAQTSNRDSYLDANGLVAQYRSDDRSDHESKMWTQLSPSAGVVHEVLPNDLQYSPFSPETAVLPRSPNRHTMNIRDTVGLGETLVNAVNSNRFRRASPDSGLGTSESHGLGQHPRQQQPENDLQPAWDGSLDQDALQEFRATLQQGDLSDAEALIEDLEDDETQVRPITRDRLVSNHTLASSNGDYLPVPSPDRQMEQPSPSDTSDSYSPHLSTRLVGNLNDLESFQDLFFRPTMVSSQRTPTEAALPESPSSPGRSSNPWGTSLRTRRTDSGLTNLARQLSDEFEQMAMEREQSSTQYTASMSSSLRQQSSLLRRPTEGSLQFLFEEAPLSASPPEDRMAFKATETLPEDILSSRASSFIEATDDDDNTAMYRVGIVESVSTPPAISTERRLSLTGHTTFMNDPTQSLASPASHDSHARILSGLQPPLTEATRSSFTSASTLSRMSGLSDFPVPPKDPNHPTPRHMSLLSSYFDEAMSVSQTDSLSMPRPSASTLLEEDRVTFGGNQSAKDLAKTLSSPQPEPF